MVRYAAEHGITDPEMLKNFDYEGYSFNEVSFKRSRMGIHA